MKEDLNILGNEYTYVRFICPFAGDSCLNIPIMICRWGRAILSHMLSSKLVYPSTPRGSV